MTPVRPIRVVFDAKFPGESSCGTLAAMGDARMEAMTDAGATDPFVSIDAGTSSLLVKVVWRQRARPGALVGGAAVIDTVLRGADVEERAALHGSTARTEHLVPVG